ncbi:MAG: dihydroxyacetone kinase subunit L [Geminicoccaceae bacterium]|nr:dihydroxyacetone kinase subunit L [Geminicoccaceae bacterium]
MSDGLIEALIVRTHATIGEHAGELTKLDQAIGDGDHGINMRRGFDAIHADREAIAAMDYADALHKAGMTLVMKVGGASGPLYGSLLMGMSKAAKRGEGIAGQLGEGIASIRARGKSDVGAKTMLDVLVPVHRALAEGRVAELRDIADEALEHTRPMQATRGRASFLGERSIGHLDPGATSARHLLHAVLDVLDARGGA